LGEGSVKTINSIAGKKPGKQDRERKVLLGLVEYFLKTNKPVGSNTLKDAGFEDLSSATIRNYFAHLEEEGYLSQQHASGGRFPTHKAYRLYAHEYLDKDFTVPEDNILFELQREETREIATYLQKAADSLSQQTKSAVFLSAPRFDHDFITGLKLVPVDHARCLCVMITDFGVIKTEVIHIDNKLSSFALKRIESYFHWRLTGTDKPDHLEREEERFAQTIYNEVMVRYIVGYSNFTNEEIYRTGFSQLLHFPEFHDPTAISNSLALFENTHSMQLLLKECSKMNRLKFWIGDDLSNFTLETPDCSVIAIPYHINQQAVGAIGILGPARMPYREMFTLMRAFSESISATLTKSVFKFKIKFRQPQQGTAYIPSEKISLLGHSPLMLLEDKRD
jgi:heat-inducible transcriptional repressor